LGLQGRQSEAESVAKADLPVDEASANVAELKRLMARRQAARGAGGELILAAVPARAN
jgi:hypothetical protein